MRQPPIHLGPAIVLAAMLAVGIGLSYLCGLLAGALDNAFLFLAVCVGGMCLLIAIVSFFERRQKPQSPPAKP